MNQDKYCTTGGNKYPGYEEVCPTCQVPLSPLPADQTPSPNAELVAVLRTTERGLLPLARVTLEQQGIDFTVDDRGLSEQLLGRRSSATVGETTQPFSILVRSEDAARARQALDDLQMPATVMPAAPPLSRQVEVPRASTGPDAIDLHDAQTGVYVSSHTEAQFEDLSAHLEQESTDDDDYYVDGPTLDLLTEASVDPVVVDALRAALGPRASMDVRWTRRAERSDR
jgi:hypothetical protein